MQATATVEPASRGYSQSPRGKSDVDHRSTPGCSSRHVSEGGGRRGAHDRVRRCTDATRIRPRRRRLGPHRRGLVGSLRFPRWLGVYPTPTRRSIRCLRLRPASPPPSSPPRRCCLACSAAWPPPRIPVRFAARARRDRNRRSARAAALYAFWLRGKVRNWQAAVLSRVRHAGLRREKLAPEDTCQTRRVGFASHLRFSVAFRALKRQAFLNFRARNE